MAKIVSAVLIYIYVLLLIGFQFLFWFWLIGLWSKTAGAIVGGLSALFLLLYIITGWKRA